ncbi:hypothetical protein LCGC14_0860470 [marine sediment metagenome]|uniref:Uncharacterized protein n=1 Tax=marine sediment metagenome TaxID=412755 RepID=A0A0F9RS83_9ZZZZ
MPIAATAVMIPSVTKAFQAMAKTKKQTWKAMERVMQEVKSSASSMGIMSSVMGIFGIVTKLALVPLKELTADLVGTDGFIEGLKSLGTVLGELVIESLDPLLGLIETFGTTFGDTDADAILLLGSLVKLSMAFSEIGNLPIYAVMGLFKAALSAFGVETEGLPTFIDGVTAAIKRLFNVERPGAGLMELRKERYWETYRGEMARGETTLGWEEWVTVFEAELARIAEQRFWAMRGSFQFGGTIPQTGMYLMHKKEEVISAGKAGRGRGEININIDLRNAVVDNVDRLSQKIAEQVLIQIG